MLSYPGSSVVNHSMTSSFQSHNNHNNNNNNNGNNNGNANGLLNPGMNGSFYPVNSNNLASPKISNQPTNGQSAKSTSSSSSSSSAVSNSAMNSNIIHNKPLNGTVQPPGMSAKSASVAENGSYFHPIESDAESKASQQKVYSILSIKFVKSPFLHFNKNFCAQLFI